MRLDQATILVVEDEPVLRLTFGIVLRQRGAVVHTAADGAEALALVEQHKVDLMLIDKHMPGIDGSALLRTLHERGIGIPSILFVSRPGGEDPSQLQRWNVVKTVTKPLHPDALVDVLESALEALQ